MEDRELLRRYVKKREVDAFSLLVDRHAHMVYATCQRILGRNDLAEDASQAVFLTLADRSADVKGEQVAGWLYRCAEYVSHRVKRGEQRRALREENSSTAARELRSEEVKPNTDLRPQLDRALGSLPRKYREPLVLHFLEDRSYAEVATALNLRQPAVRQRVLRGIKLLRERLAHTGLVLSAAFLLTSVQAEAAVTAPAKFIASIKAVSLGATTANAGAITMMKGLTEMLFWTKVKTLATVTVTTICLAVIGTIYCSGILFAANADVPPKEKAVAENDPATDPPVVKKEARVKLPRGKKARTARLREVQKEASRLRSRLRQLERSFRDYPAVAAALEASSEASREKSAAFKDFMEKLKTNKKWQDIEARRNKLGARDEGSKHFMRATKQSNKLYEKLVAKDPRLTKANADFAKRYREYLDLLHKTAAVNNAEYAALRDDLEVLKPEFVALQVKVNKASKSVMEEWRIPE